MKTLKDDELYQSVHGFLKTKGVELQPGSYSQKIQKGCQLLSDAINVGQQGLSRAKGEIDKKLDQLRQVIHEKTAPSGTGGSAPNSEPTSKKREPTGRSRAKKRPAPKTHRKRKPAAG